jgi:predicted nucleic acid-binding protein
MIIADSSVWIDYFANKATPQVELLDNLLGNEELLVGDLILAEVLQGTDRDIDFARVHRIMLSFEQIQIGGRDVAVQAAQNYRWLRNRGITVRKTIDTLIATRCIMDGHELLHSDRDFDPFVEHLGLRLAKP